MKHPIPFVNGYINDAVAIPVIANLSLWYLRVLIIKNNYYILSTLHVIFIVVYTAVTFEILLPYFSRAYTADGVDVLLYAAGGVFFHKIMNKPASVKTRKLKKTDFLV